VSGPYRNGVYLVACVVAAAVVGAQPPRETATGTLTIDGVATQLTHAIRITKPNPFNDFFSDTVVMLTDRALTEKEASDDAAVLARAQKGELVAVAVRFDGRPRRGQLFNVAISHKGLTETALLPDVWFKYGFKDGVGKLSLESREFSGRRYAADVAFAVTMPVVTTEAAAETAAGGGALPPPSKTDADRKRASALLIEALQEGDEARALAIVELGIDPDVRDDKMKIPLINWAILMCQPPIVRALAVDLKADLSHERLPGMTLLSEAVAACPEAVPALKQAGAK
jgi:hypothetical protein